MSQEALRAVFESAYSRLYKPDHKITLGALFWGFDLDNDKALLHAKPKKTQADYRATPSLP